MPFQRRAVGAAIRPGTAVLLPGSGSDDVFVTEAFAEPLTDAGFGLHAPRPCPGPQVAEHLVRELDRAAVRFGGPMLAGGVSLGAHLATNWAIRNPERCAGLLVALPAWTGAPGDAPPEPGPQASPAAPALVAALAAADLVTTRGIDAALAQARDGSPGWLADELDRAWRRYGSELAASLRAVARTPGPKPAELSRLGLPVGIVALTDDPLHPLAVAREWAANLPRAALVTTSLAEVGRDRRALGRAAVQALQRATPVA